MKTLHTATRLASVSAILVALVASTSACWELDNDVYVEGNYALTHSDLIKVYWGEDLIAEIDPAQGGTLELGEYSVEYDEFCSDPDVSCPTEVFWDEVAIYQPLGTDNALLNAVNIGTIGEPGARLAGVIESDGSFWMLLGLSASWNENCISVGISDAQGTFTQTGMGRENVYNNMETGTISVTYAAGCEVIDNVTIASSLTFESDFTGVRTGDLDLGDVEPDPAIDEDGEEVDDNLDELDPDQL